MPCAVEDSAPLVALPVILGEVLSSHRMTALIEVSFKGNRKEFFLWEGEELPTVNAPVIVDADRGEDLGYVYAVGELAEKRNSGVAHGFGQSLPTKKARRLASKDDVRRLDEVRAQDDDAR